MSATIGNAPLADERHSERNSEMIGRCSAPVSRLSSAVGSIREAVQMKQPCRARICGLADDCGRKEWRLFLTDSIAKLFAFT